MEHRTANSSQEAFAPASDFEVMVSFIGAAACLDVLENLISEGATPVNVARQTGLMRHAVENAKRELARRGLPALDLKITAVSSINISPTGVPPAGTH